MMQCVVKATVYHFLKAKNDKLCLHILSTKIRANDIKQYNTVFNNLLEKLFVYVAKKH